MGNRRYRILDTNVLINHWRRLPRTQQNVQAARQWASQLIEVYNTHWIVSPVRIEFLAGAERSDLKTRLAYVDAFKILDNCQIPRQDWEEAERIAKRVGRDGRRRQLGDCLLKAIAERLHCDVVTNDSGFERRVRP